MTTAYALARKVSRAAEDARIRNETAIPRAIARAFDNGIEIVAWLGPRTFRINSGTRENRVYHVHVQRKGVEANHSGYCSCEGAWLGTRLCQHLALAFLHLGRIDASGNVLPPQKRRRVILTEDVIRARLAKYVARAERQLALVQGMQQAG